MIIMEKPAPQQQSDYIYITNKEALDALTEALRKVQRAGIDTEANGLHRYFEKVCLIQINVSGVCYIVDPLNGYALTDFFAVLCRKELILHGADYDLRMLRKTFEFRPQAPVFDTKVAAQVLGYEKFGLAALVEKFFGVVLPKTGQKADWSKRPIPVKLLHYAAGDVKYLESLTAILSKELAESGRLDWHRQCCERVVESTGIDDKGKSKEPWQIKGSSKLPPRTLAFVRELWYWRDGEAQLRDRPPFMIMHNEDLIAVAEWRVKNPKQPLECGPAFLKRFSGQVLERLEKAILKAEKLSADEWPVFPKKSFKPKITFEYEKVEKLAASCKEIASELSMEPSFIASRAMMETIIQKNLRSVQEMVETGGMMPWQAELIAPAAEKILD